MAHFIWNIGAGGKPAITFTIDPKGGITAHHSGRGTSMFFGTDVTISQIVDGQRKRTAGAMIQDAMPFLCADRREFLLSGLTPEMWDEMLNEPSLQHRIY